MQMAYDIFLSSSTEAEVKLHKHEIGVDMELDSICIFTQLIRGIVEAAGFS